MRMVMCLLVVLLSIYSVTSGCPPCNISHVESWMFSVNDGVGTARCCPKSGASAGAFLLWPNGSNITPANYSRSQSDGCDEISIALSDQHCHMKVVCRTFWGRPVQKEATSIELNSCSSLFSSSDSKDLLQVCLNCTDRYHDREVTTDSKIIITTTSTVTVSIFSTAATPVISNQINNSNVPVIAVVAVAVLLLGITSTLVVFIILRRNRRKKYVVKQAEEDTNLLNPSTNGLRSAPNSSTDPPLERTAVDLQVTTPQPFSTDESPGHEAPDPSSPCNTEDSRSSPIEQGKIEIHQCSSQPDDGETTSGFVLQASNRLYLPRSLSKDTDDVVRCIPENDSRIRNFSRSLSCPNSCPNS